MKSIHYDSEGDILTVTFVEVNNQPARCIELNDNVVLYYNTKTKKPVELILISYQAMLKASTVHPTRLDGLGKLPTSVRNTILQMMRRPPVSFFLRIVETRGRKTLASYPTQVLTPIAMKAVA